MDFSSHNPTTSNSLNLAARQNDVANVRRLLKKINPNCVDNRGWTCLHEAANSDSYKSLVLILKHPDCRPLAETHEGHTALYLACRNRASKKTITHILKNVHDIANYSSTEGVSPLHEVSSQGRLEVIQLLLDYGAMIDAQDFDGDTPLHDACLAQKPEAVKLLLYTGANPNIQNQHNLFTPFHIACNRSLEAVNHLIHFIEDINQRTATGDTPLMLALHCDINDLIVKFLLDNGADPNLKNADDKLALDVAMDLGHSVAFKELLLVTDNSVINENIVCRACKPHYFSLEILGSLLYSDLGTKYFEFIEPCPDSFVETINELKPTYLMHAPLNAYLNICEYIYVTSLEKFKEYFYLFLMKGVGVNAVQPTEFPPLSYLHYCSLNNCFQDVFEILIKHGCNVDYCSTGDQCPKITDAFLASLCSNPRTALIMLPYSLYCDPGSLIDVAERNGIIDRMPLLVLNNLLEKIDERLNKQETLLRTSFVPSLKHLSRLQVREMIKAKDGVLKTTQEFLEILDNLPVPRIIKDYLRFL